jgi:hypothetical protein
MGIMVPLMKSAILRAHVGGVATDAKVVHQAFKQYYIDNDMYPSTAGLQTFEPLVTEGYYDGRIFSRLENDEADGYGSPDDGGMNQEYWMEFTLKVDPSIRFLIADSDNSLLGGGDFFDGIYMFKDGALTPLTSPVDLQ